MYSFYATSEITGYYNHMIVRVEIDNGTNTYTYTVPANIDTINSSLQPGFHKVVINASSQVVGFGVVSGSTQESVAAGIAGLPYTKTAMQALTDIPANTAGNAIASGLAFEELTVAAGSEFLGKYIKTDTNYAVEKL